jgi:hypothetical protein
MAKQKDSRNVTDLLAIPTNPVTVLPPSSGVVGQFLEETANMFKARAMRMGGLLRRINESGQRTESLLRAAAERMEAAEAALEGQFKSEGLVPENDLSDELPE